MNSYWFYASFIDFVNNIHVYYWFSFFLFFFLKILFIHLTERDTAREGTQAGGLGEGEAGFPPSREPDAGLDPRTPGS